MQYKNVKGASSILNSSDILIKNPENYKNKWNDLFGNKNPINIELGMGYGSFIIKMAKTHPDQNYIGIELDINQAAKAVSNAKNLNLKNLKMICADASNIINFFGKEISRIYLTFSEPWPKKNDKDRRFTSTKYLRLYDRIYKKEKHITLKTDNKILFASSLETLSDYWYTFDVVSLDLHNDERKIEDENVLTDFEAHYVKENRNIYYLDAIFKD